MAAPKKAKKATRQSARRKSLPRGETGDASLKQELAEARAEQAATAEILNVIARSPSDVQPVFDAIVESAARLFGRRANLRLVERGGLRRNARSGTAANSQSSPELLAIDKDSYLGRTVLEKRALQVADMRAADASPLARANAHKWDFRASAAAPLLRNGNAIGVISVTSPDPGRMSDKQMALLATFADQAVIAIENVRLFNETRESLERQTATAEILKVIASSPSDVQPVFDAIAQSAKQLLGGHSASVRRVVGDMLHLVAYTSTGAAGDAVRKDNATVPIAQEGSTNAQAVRTRKPAARSDTEADPDIPPVLMQLARARGYRSTLAVPMMLDGIPVGTINVTRREPGSFAQHQINLLETFADQAVIAIENVRLFNETKEALERQTATAEVLNVISSSPTDVQPVFEAIARSGKRLCEARECGVFRFDGELIHLVALAEVKSAWSEALRGAFPSAPSRTSITSRSILARAVVQVPDILADPDYLLHEAAQKTGIRSVLSVPLVRDGQVVGAITVDRTEPVPFLDKQVSLLQTFADQAVIAIENVRLFTELQAQTKALTRSVGQLTALGEVGQAISSTLDLETVLQTIVARAVQLTGLDGGSIYEYDERAETFHLKAAENMEPELLEAVRKSPVRKGDGAVGGVAVTKEPIQVADSLDDSYQSARKEMLVRAGYRAIIAVPLLREDNLLGALLVNRKTPGPFAPEVVELLKTFATQSAMAIQNARLFREIAEKGKQLEIASRHKSDFLANMSHELRTPLNAIIGFSEVLRERMFGELNEKQADYLKDIHDSGRHLLSLINDILDLTKIEAGRMDLDVVSFDLPSALANAMTLVRERAQRQGIALGLEVDPGLGEFRADERKFKQILLNLLSNAVKFTPEGGRVDVTATKRGGAVQVAVKDSGIGIAAEDHAAVFEEFKQVGSDYTRKAEGTGLGLALTRRFVELHGGEIRLASRPGEGSTFSFTLPERA